MDINYVIKYAVNEVRSGKVKLHKLFLNEVLDLIISKDIYELRNMEQSAFYLPEKEYYSYIVKCMEEILKIKI
jgi:hypothetical protein